MRDIVPVGGGSINSGAFVTSRKLFSVVWVGCVTLCNVHVCADPSPAVLFSSSPATLSTNTSNLGLFLETAYETEYFPGSSWRAPVPTGQSSLLYGSPDTGESLRQSPLRYGFGNNTSSNHSTLTADTLSTEEHDEVEYTLTSNRNPATQGVSDTAERTAPESILATQRSVGAEVLLYNESAPYSRGVPASQNVSFSEVIPAAPRANVAAAESVVLQPTVKIQPDTQFLNTSPTSYGSALGGTGLLPSYDALYEIGGSYNISQTHREEHTTSTTASGAATLKASIVELNSTRVESNTTRPSVALAFNASTLANATTAADADENLGGGAAKSFALPGSGNRTNETGLLSSSSSMSSLRSSGINTVGGRNKTSGSSVMVPPTRKKRKLVPVILVFIASWQSGTEFANATRVTQLLKVALEDAVYFTYFHKHQVEKNTGQFIDTHIRYKLVAVSETTSSKMDPGAQNLTRWLRWHLSREEYAVPGIALLSTTSITFLKLAATYQVYGLPLLTPRPLLDRLFAASFPNVVSFAPLYIDQAKVLVDACLLMSWRRVVLVGTLSPESLALSSEFYSQAAEQHITIHTIRASFGTAIDSANGTCSPEHQDIEPFAGSLAAAFSVLDYSIFIFTVDAVCFLRVVAAVRLAKLDTQLGVALVFSDSGYQLFPQTKTYFYGNSGASDNVGITLRADNGYTRGWLYVLPGNPRAWKMGNIALHHRLYQNVQNRTSADVLKHLLYSKHIYGLYELLLYDVVRAVAQKVLLAKLEESSSVLCRPQLKPFEALRHRDPYFVESAVQRMQQRIRSGLAAVYDVQCVATPATTANKTHSPIASVTRNSNRNATRLFGTNAANYYMNAFRPPFLSTSKTTWLVFDSLTGHVVINAFGADVPRFAFFNVIPNATDSTAAYSPLIPKAVALWDTQDTLDSEMLPERNALARHLIPHGQQILAHLPDLREDVFFDNALEPGNGALNADLPLPLFEVNPPNGASDSNNEEEKIPLPNYLIELNFPGSLSNAVPKDCLFCDRTTPLVTVTYCKICEEDRLELHAILRHLLQHNKFFFKQQSVSNLENIPISGLKPGPRPTERSVCELWPLVVRCVSPLTYVLYLEGLDLQGPLPPNLGRLKHAEELRLARNYFEGPLPSFAPNLCRWGFPPLPHLVNILQPWMNTKVEVNKLKGVYLSRNLFTGTIPADWKNCGALRVLYLDNNQINGPIPVMLCSLQALTELDVSNNKLDGPLPSCIGETGDEQNAKDGQRGSPSGWKNLRYFDAQRNGIHGTIPESFRELSGLGTLNLRRNALEGVIPDIWGNMPPSFALDISENGRFHTPLPTSLVRRVLFRPENILLDPYLYDCPPGYHAPLDSDGERHATDALLDTVSNRTLADLCKACPKGTAVTNDARRCLPCPAGTVATQVASSHCVKCAPGTFSTARNTTCFPCPPGEYSYLEGSTMCHPCPSNHYTDISGSIFCIAVGIPLSVSFRLQCPKGANCTTPLQKTSPQAAAGWYRVYPSTVGKTSEGFLLHAALRKDWEQTRLLFRAGRSLQEKNLLNLSYDQRENFSPLIKSSPILVPELREKQIQRSLGIYTCPKPSHCIGNNVCSSFSYGPFCHRCVPGYTTALWSLNCHACPSRAFTVLRFVGIAAVALLVLFFVFKMFRSVGKHEQRLGQSSGCRVFSFNRNHAVILKIFTNWLELTAQALVYAIQAALGNDGDTGEDFSSQLEGVYNFIQNLDDPFFVLLPLDCLLPAWGPSPLHCGLLIGLFVPIVVFCGIACWQYRRCWSSAVLRWINSGRALFGSQQPAELRRKNYPLRVDNKGSSAFWSPTRKTKKTVASGSRDAKNASWLRRRRVVPAIDWDKRSNNGVLDTTENGFEVHSSPAPLDNVDPWSETVGIFTVVFFLIHPAVTRQFLKNLDCTDVDVSRLTRDYTFVCTEAPHKIYVRLAWVGLMGWTFGLPLVFCLNMRHHRHHLLDRKVLAQWGFLLDGYEHRYYWWEIWAMIRKVLLDVPPMVPFLDGDLQHVAMLSLAVVSLVAHVSAEPFDNRCFKVADCMETYVLWTFLLTLITVPIQQVLNTHASNVVCRLASRVILVLTVLASLLFLVWAVLFYLRPIIHRRLQPKLLCVADIMKSQTFNHTFPEENLTTSNSLQHCSCSQSEIRTPEVSQKSTMAASIVDKESKKNGNRELRTKEFCQLGLATTWCSSRQCSPITGTCEPQQETTTTCQPMAGAFRQYVIGWTYWLWNYRDRNCTKACCAVVYGNGYHGLQKRTSKALFLWFTKTVLRLHSSKVYLTYPDHHLDISQLTFSEKRFLREVVITDLLNANFCRCPERLNAHFVCSMLARTFRIKAFELRVRETRLRLSQLKSYCDDGETEKPAAVFWGRSVSLEAYPQLRPLLHAVHVAKKTKLFRFQSLTEALTVKREVASAVVLPEANVNELLPTVTTTEGTTRESNGDMFASQSSWNESQGVGLCKGYLDLQNTIESCYVKISPTTRSPIRNGARTPLQEASPNTLCLSVQALPLESLQKTSQALSQSSSQAAFDMKPPNSAQKTPKGSPESFSESLSSKSPPERLLEDSRKNLRQSVFQPAFKKYFNRAPRNGFNEEQHASWCSSASRQPHGRSSATEAKRRHESSVIWRSPPVNCVTPCRLDMENTTNGHSEARSCALRLRACELWKKASKIVRWTHRFINTLRSFPYDMDGPSAEIGLTIEELQQSVANINMCLFRQTNV